ncbi:MAG TPA: glycosyltransferase family 4 protein [Gemmataceae bacterium]|jgi:glycosyltransferase involved in cell wall biosynthesis|nr:glycosyltransferase family 4 protein [Gemmataceae bacterium]
MNESLCPSVGYIPFAPHQPAAEAQWLEKYLHCQVRCLEATEHFNLSRNLGFPSLPELQSAVQPLIREPWIVLEGTGAFLWAAILRLSGFGGGLAILPYLNPTCLHDILCTALYRRVHKPIDKVFLGSRQSARLYHALGIPAQVGEPYGIDSATFQIRHGTSADLAALGIPSRRMLLYTGRVEPDKGVHHLLRVGLKARLLFPDLILVIASHRIDPHYGSLLSDLLNEEHGTYLLQDPTTEQLVTLYNHATLFVTAATSYYETFGRAPLEALACGALAIGPRYDGFCDTLAGPGGILVDLSITNDSVSVDEDALLRAVYDVLSRPPSLSRSEISAAAHAAFSRSLAIRLLDFTLKPAPPCSPQALGWTPDCLPLPCRWRAVIAYIGSAPLDVAVAACLRSEGHADLAKHDDGFQLAVRQFLASPAVCKTAKQHRARRQPDGARAPATSLSTHQGPQPWTASSP